MLTPCRSTTRGRARATPPAGRTLSSKRHTLSTTRRVQSFPSYTGCRSRGMTVVSSLQQNSTFQTWPNLAPSRLWLLCSPSLMMPPGAHWEALLPDHSKSSYMTKPCTRRSNASCTPSRSQGRFAFTLKEPACEFSTSEIAELVIELDSRLTSKAEFDTAAASPSFLF